MKNRMKVNFKKNRKIIQKLLKQKFDSLKRSIKLMSLLLE